MMHRSVIGYSPYIFLSLNEHHCYYIVFMGVAIFILNIDNILKFFLYKMMRQLMIGSNNTNCNFTPLRRLTIGQ